MQLYRYERLSYLIDMLRSGTVSLAHPSRWPDPYETSFLTAGSVTRHAMVKGPDGRWYSGLPRKADSVTAHMKVTNHLGRYVFAQCFTESSETERMWLAAQSDNRVRWSVDSERYVAALRASAGNRPISLVKVDYRPQATVNEVHRSYVERYGGIVGRRAHESWCRDVVVPFATKRSEFSDEREHRLVLIDTDLLSSPHSAGSLDVRERFILNLPLSDLVNDVLLSPMTTMEEAERIEASLRGAGFRGPVTRSSLYAMPNHDLVVEKPISAA